MLKGFCAGLLLVVGLSATNSAEAIRMDYYVEWRCTSAYVTVDGWTYPAGVYCTSFIIASTVYEPAGNDLQYWDNTYAGGGAFRYRVGQKIPDNPLNNEPAVCTSDELTRWLHATKDVAAYNAQRIATAQGPLATGALVRVTYDDGGSEVWTVASSYSSSPLVQAPMGGSLKCPES